MTVPALWTKHRPIAECLRRGVTKKKVAEAMGVPASTFRGVKV